MKARASTIANYKKCLTEFLEANLPMELKQISDMYRIDVKFPSWLAKHGYIDKIVGNDTYKANYFLSAVDRIIEEFISYREHINDKYTQDQRDLAYYQTNKDFLVDIRKTPSLTDTMVADIQKATRESIIDEVITYVELAQKMGKADIKSFVKLLLETK